MLPWRIKFQAFYVLVPEIIISVCCSWFLFLLVLIFFPSDKLGMVLEVIWFRLHRHNYTASIAPLSAASNQTLSTALHMLNPDKACWRVASVLSPRSLSLTCFRMVVGVPIVWVACFLFQEWCMYSGSRWRRAHFLVTLSTSLQKWYRCAQCVWGWESDDWCHLHNLTCKHKIFSENLSGRLKFVEYSRVFHDIN